MESELLSICVPVYNAASTLESCVASIAAQTYRNLEIILVDDGSTDGSPKICKRLAKKDGRIRVIRQKNSGVGAARNTAIEASRGKYLAFVDADDRVAREMYAVLYRDAVSSGSGLVLCNFVQEKGTRASARDQFRMIEENDPRVRQKLFEGMFSPSEENIMASSCTLLVSRELLLKNGIRFPAGIRMSEDMLFVLRCLDAAGSVSVERSFLYFYRVNESSATRNYIDGIWGDMMTVIDWSEKHLEDRYGVGRGIRRSVANAAVLAASNSCKRGTPMNFLQRVAYCRKLEKEKGVAEAVRSALGERRRFRRRVWPQILCLGLRCGWLLILYHSLKHGTLIKAGRPGGLR